jgi:hypothetical protein
MDSTQTEWKERALLRSVERQLDPQRPCIENDGKPLTRSCEDEKEL